MIERIEICNAVIERVSIDVERGLTAWLHLSYGGSGQGFGGYSLYWPPYDKEKLVAGQHLLGNYAGLFVYRCIQIGGVEKWEQLVGKTIRARQSHTKVHAIGHIVKDDWFNPAEEFERVSTLTKAAT